MDDKIHNLRDALEWLERRIRDEAELDGEITNDHAIELGFIQNMLEKFPLRNCDVGTAEEQAQRFDDDLVPSCKADEYCRCKNAARCFAQWSQMPYEVKEGGAGDAN